MYQHNKKNEKTPNTFVDGVPVKISEQYKPPRKITLPFSCQNCSPSESLYTEYDFRLENSVMTKLTEWKRMRQEEVERRKERLKGVKEVRQDIDNFHNLTIRDEERSEPMAAETSKPIQQQQPQPQPHHLQNQQSNPKMDNSILTPVSVKANSPSSKPSSSVFDLSVFESDNSSPFDNMELKTINDMEVLASILTSDNMKQSFNNNYNIIDKELNKNGLAYGKGSDWSQSQPVVNGYDNNSYVLPGYNGSVIPTCYADRYGPTPNSLSENYQLYNYELNNFSNQCGAGVPSGPASSLRHPETRHLDTIIQDSGFRTELTSQKTNSKSVPDIVNELLKELKESKELERAAERKTKTPPPVAQGSQKQQLPESSKSGKKPGRKLSDPTTNLNSELLGLARHISEMGFPLPRVARACLFFEGDDKKVIEFLLQVQTLEEEKNYPGDMIERALIVNDLKTEDALNYLSSMVVLLDLGFDEERVEEALKKANSDRDKALDMLIS